jgi:hypothetical protein
MLISGITRQVVENPSEGAPDAADIDRGAVSIRLKPAAAIVRQGDRAAVWRAIPRGASPQAESAIAEGPSPVVIS